MNHTDGVGVASDMASQTKVSSSSSIMSGQSTFSHVHDSKFALHAEDVTIAYGATMVVQDVDLEIEHGTVSAIVGPNGAGKSTLMKGALGLIPMLTGSITLLGEPFAKVRNRVAYVPQTDSVNWDFPTTVFDVTLMGRYVHRGWIRHTTKEDERIAREALEIMGMEQFANRQISELSGGQRQRVFLARALASDAQMYMLDEPLAGVDKKTEELIMSVLHTFRDQGKTAVVVHHDLATIPSYFDHVCLLNKRLIAAGPVESTFTSENIERAFGVKAGGLLL